MTISKPQEVHAGDSNSVVVFIELICAQISLCENYWANFFNHGRAFSKHE